MEPGLAEAILVLIVVALVFGFAGFMADLRAKKTETIKDGYSPSERGPWR